jgi:capsular exopolysaccharide synthesis family protein
MSRLYESLLQAEQKLKLKERAEITSADDSVLAEIEALVSISAEGSNPYAEEPSPPILSTVEEILTPLELPSQVATSYTDQPSAGFTRKRFRHLVVPFQENSRVAFHTNPHGLVAEQFRLLRRTLNQEFGAGAVLMISSPGIGDGKTLTSVNLCACLADSGDSTLLVETDMRRPTAHKILGCQVEPPGIEDALAGKVNPDQAIHFVEGLCFHAAIVAKPPDNTSRLINGASTKQFLTWAREHFRWIVLDSAPVVPVADAAELLPFADAVLLVIRAQSTPRVLLKEAFELLGKRLHGVIFNDASIDSNPYFCYLNNYHHGSSTTNG